MKDKFYQNLKFGVIGENWISKWLLSRGHTILPVYEKEIDTGKGPRLFTPQNNLIAPDMLVFTDEIVLWIEAKHKSAFTWHRLSQRWVTGIDLKHYNDYCEISDRYTYEVWLLFLHEGKQAKDSPPDSPSGLFGNKIKYLRENENHRHHGWGKSGMVYWNVDSLVKLADYRRGNTNA